jgi:hypothetical protein
MMELTLDVLGSLTWVSKDALNIVRGDFLWMSQSFLDGDGLLVDTTQGRRFAVQVVQNISDFMTPENRIITFEDGSKITVVETQTLYVLT